MGRLSRISKPALGAWGISMACAVWAMLAAILNLKPC